MILAVATKTRHADKFRNAGYSSQTAEPLAMSLVWLGIQTGYFCLLNDILCERSIRLAVVPNTQKSTILK